MAVRKRGTTIAKHILACLKSGFWPFLTVGLVVYFVKTIFYILVPGITGRFTQNGFLSVFVILTAIYFLGVLVRHTSFVEWLRRVCEGHPLLLIFVRIFPGRRSEGSDFTGLEVLFEERPNVRMRGYIGNEPIRTKNGTVWIVVHFSSPPTAKTGGWAKEICADNPCLKFTGRTLSDHISYILTWGGGIDVEDEEKIERITEKYRAMLLQNPSRE